MIASVLNQASFIWWWADDHTRTADQDPLLKKEEKLWKKKQAEYDPENEAQSDTPIARKTTDDDDPAYCVSPSLKTCGTSRSNIDSVIQCSIEDQLQGDYLDLFGAFHWRTLKHITELFIRG